MSTKFENAPERPKNDGEWRTWLAENGRRMLLCARQWTNSLHDAEDAVQEGFARFWKSQRHLPGNVDALILTSIRRAAIDMGRSRRRRIDREQKEFEDTEQVEWFEAHDSGENALIEAALKKLPADQREVVVMKIWGNMTFAEIAESLGITVSTVASRYRYALATLKEDLQKLF